MAALCSESSDLVGGVVHPLSGLPLVACTDLVVKGAQELLLNRIYIPLQMPWQFPQHTGFLLGIAEIVVGGAICFTGGMLEVASFGGYTFAFGFHEAAGIALMTHGCAQAAYHSRDMVGRPSHSTRVENKHTPDQAAISDLVKQSGKKKKTVSNADADTLLDWAREYDFPHRDDRGKDHWDGGEQHPPAYSSARWGVREQI